ncbi:ParA family protein [Nocardia salmonicida]|uniref:ParA family protein n=1 Tax=Nocardia salmonicida TaxID=53431 RepID=UPI0009FF28C9|nr:AAA family ATPase [Nocardia salmonicida]MBC7299782.1 AAA family ATPase [Nocardia sp.]
MSSKRPIRLVVVGAGGSSGKTTECVNLGCALARRGLTVRFIDGDQQGDTSKYLHYNMPDFVLGEVLGGVEVVEDAAAPSGRRAPTLREAEVPIYRATEEEAADKGGIAPQTPEQEIWLRRLTLVPSGSGSTGATLGSAVTAIDRDPMGAEKALRALDRIDEGRPDDEIPDIEIFDLHGTVTTMTYLALRWAARGANNDAQGRSGAFCVVTPDDKSTGDHLKEAIDLVAEVAEFDKVEVLGIIPTRIRPATHGRFYVDMYERLCESYGDLVTPTVREAVTAAESYAAREPLLLWVPDSPVTQDQENVVDWMAKKGVVVI